MYYQSVWIRLAHRLYSDFQYFLFYCDASEDDEVYMAEQVWESADRALPSFVYLFETMPPRKCHAANNNTLLSLFLWDDAI